MVRAFLINRCDSNKKDVYITFLSYLRLCGNVCFCGHYAAVAPSD